MPQSAEVISEILGTDTPTTNDLLGHKRLTEPVVRRIINATGKSTPLTIGVYGEWGSGKTSFLKMIDEALTKHDIHPVWFNAWKYDQEENLWSALIQTILDQATVRGNWYRRVWVKFNIWRDSFDLSSGYWEIAKRITPLAIRIIIIGLILLVVFGWSSSDIEAFLAQVSSRWFSSSPLLLAFFQVNVIKTFLGIVAFLALKPDELIKLFSPKLGIDFSKFRRSASYRAHIAFLDDFSAEFKRIIRLVGRGKPLVVIIDDLDRCLPEKAIQVLEAIKLFLDVEGCVFLLAVDRVVVEKAIAVKYKDLVAMAKETDTSPQQLFTLLGENYFEKIVQLPFSLPPISNEQFRYFLTKVHPDHDVQLCASIFTEGFPRNPRKVKRLLQSFLFLRDLDLLGDSENRRKKPSLIAKMVVIQNQFRRVYEEIVDSPALLPELERHFRRQASLSTTESPPEPITDPVLSEKVEAFSVQYPNLRKLLLQKVSEDDTFVDIDLAPYVSLVEPIIETQVVSETIDVGGSLTLSGSLQTELIPGALGQYLTQVISLTRALNLRSITFSALSVKRLEIGNLFVAPLFTATGNNERSLTLDDILQKSVRVVILGGAGSGKTTLLSYIAYIFANARSRDDIALVQERFGISDNLLPILIPLRDYESFLNQNRNPSSSPVGFVDFLNYYFSQWNINLPSDFFVYFLERGNCIILLDGLDEVRSSERQYLTQTILAATKRYPAARFIVTSRPATYLGYGLGEDFTHYEIQNFNDSAVANFIRNWSAIATEDAIQANQNAESLLQTIQRNANLQDLVKNPLFLTILVTLHNRGKPLPLRRVDLYEQCINVLLERWEAIKGIKTLEYSFVQIRALLAALAYFMLRNGTKLTIDESSAVSVFSKVLKRMKTSNTPIESQSINLLSNLKERSAVLIEISPHEFAFVHQGIQAYLASIELVDNNDFGFILQNYKDSGWEETIVLAVALFNQKSAEHIIRALAEMQDPEGLIVAGLCLLEVKGANPELRSGIINSIKALLDDPGITKILLDRATELLERLSELEQ